MTTNDELICPDCGGVVGGSTTPGVSGCRCFVVPARKMPTEKTQPQAAGSAPAGKFCCVCGKDVSKGKRFREERGYVCLACDLEEKARDADKMPCPECGRSVKESSLVVMRARLMCKLCAADERDNALPRVTPIRVASDTPADKRKLLVIAGVLGLVVMVLVLKQLGFF